MDMLFKYKGAFSLRDEIGTCPNIEVEIDVTDKSPFFISLRKSLDPNLRPENLHAFPK